MLNCYTQCPACGSLGSHLTTGNQDDYPSDLMTRILKTSVASAESVLRKPGTGVAEILGRDFWWENSFYPL